MSEVMIAGGFASAVIEMCRVLGLMWSST